MMVARNRIPPYVTPEVLSQMTMRYDAMPPEPVEYKPRWTLAAFVWGVCVGVMIARWMEG